MREKMLALTIFLFLACLSSFVLANDTVKPITQRAAIQGKFTPPAGQSLLFIGQDSDTIREYAAALPQDKLEGITLYTQLKSAQPNKTLLGIFSSADWQSGTIDYAQTLALAHDAALAIGLALDECKQAPHSQLVAQGEYDKSLAVLISYLKSLAPRKVFLRIGYEFDGPWNCYKPASYQAAFRYIAQQLKASQADNVTTVWQSATWPDPTIAGADIALYDNREAAHLNTWYPGDDVVDWVAMSVFYRDLSQWHYQPVDTPQAAQQKVLDFARTHHKPVMIAEAAPQGYRTAALSHSYIALNNQTARSAEQIWQDWFQPFFDFIHLNQDVIRAVAYINTNWESQSRWQCALDSGPPKADCPEGNWGDSRVQAQPYIKQKWLNEIGNAQYWVQGNGN